MTTPDKYCIEIRMYNFSTGDPDGQHSIYCPDKEQAIKLAIRHLMLEASRLDSKPEVTNDKPMGNLWEVKD